MATKYTTLSVSVPKEYDLSKIKGLLVNPCVEIIEVRSTEVGENSLSGNSLEIRAESTSWPNDAVILESLKGFPGVSFSLTVCTDSVQVPFKTVDR